jgi:murein DD-endopeptidase MepM/ murein hydrolase activator NlpD
MFSWPVNGSVISTFGVARDGGARSHEGIDIGSPVGTQIAAVASGRVFKAGQISATAGLGVEIDHVGGWISKYFHLSSVYASVGQQVGQGQVIGLVGKTGNAANTPPHLHFEVWANGRAVDPLTVLQSGAGLSVGGVQVNSKVLLVLLVIVVLSRL